MNNAVRDLVIGNTSSVSMNGPVDVYRSLTYDNNGNTLNTNGNLTLKSTIDETAWIGNMTGHTIIGNVTVERYINVGTGSGQHGKKWMFLATPTEGQSIRDSWMEGGAKVGTGIHQLLQLKPTIRQKIFGWVLAIG